MFSKILINFIIFTVCYCYNTDEATSAISYQRGDVPLSYNFSQIHKYALKETENHSNKRSPQNAYNTIQYAPIFLEAKEQTIETTSQSLTSNIVPEDENEHTKRKKPTEPKVQEIDGDNAPYNAFISDVRGHNIFIPQPIMHYRNLQKSEHNRENRNHAQREFNIESYYKRFPMTEAYYSKATTTTTSTTPKTDLNDLIQPNENILKNQQLIQSALRGLNLQFARHALYKLPRLSINEARRYNIANQQLQMKNHQNNVRYMQENRQD